MFPQHQPRQLHLLSLDFVLAKVLFISNAKIDLDIHTPNNVVFIWTVVSEYNTQLKVIMSQPKRVLPVEGTPKKALLSFSTVLIGALK